MQRQRWIATGLLALFWAAIVAKALLTRWLVLGDAAVWTALVLEGPLILAVLLVVDAFFADHRVKAFSVVDLAFSVVFAATSLYGAYYGGIPSRDALAGAGQASSVTASIVSLVEPIHALYFVDLAALAAVGIGVLMRRRSARAETSEERGYVFQYRLTYALLVPLLLVPVIGAVAVRRMPQPVDPLAAARLRGVLTYQLAMVRPLPAEPVGTLGSDPMAVQKAIEELVGAPDRTGERVTPELRGSNVVLIQVEALQSAVLDAEVGGQPVAPNLRRLATRSWYFPQCISQVGKGTTSDAELLSNASVYPAQTGPSSVVYANRVLPSLPRLLGEQGYDTMTFHTNSASYWNRTQLYAALGFDRYYDAAYFGDADKIAFGASDQVLFDRTLEQLESRQRTGTPFYAQIVTQSSHHPYVGVPRERVPLELPASLAGTLTGRYLEEQSYVDAQIGHFLDRLEETGLAENTIVVIYGDHFGLPERPDDARDAAARVRLFGDDYSIVERQSVPLIVHVPGQERGERVESAVGQIDLMPTVADLLGLDLSAYPHFGRSVFEDGERIMPAGGFMAVGTYVDGETLYVPGPSFERGNAYSVRSAGERVELHNADRVKWERMRRLVLVSDAYVRSLPKRADYDPDASYQLPD